MKKINIRPTTSVYATYKNMTYHPWTALAEFIDNSTQSYYSNREKLKRTKYWKGLMISITQNKDDLLEIKDNAYGMNFEDFKRAVILDSPPKKKTRSEFGMGLKTAACWFGDVWSVESVELGSGIKYKATIDIAHLHKYKNEEIDVEEIECSKKEHGTTITIRKLNKRIQGRQLGKTKDQLKGMYKCDIVNENIQLLYNGEVLVIEDVPILEEDLPNGKKRLWKKQINIDFQYEEKNYNVNGFVALRKKAATAEAGFVLLRRGRAIIGGIENNYRPEEIFGKSNSFVYQRMFGELNLDDWPVTQTKDNFDWYNGLEDVLIEKLKEECTEYIQKAKDYRKGKKIELDENIDNLVKTFEKSGLIANVEVQNISNDLQDIKKVVSNNESGIKIEGGKGKEICFEYRDNKYRFELIIENSDPFMKWLGIVKKNDKYVIQWNILHPFFKPYIDDENILELLENFIFAFALSEIEAMELNVLGKIHASDIRIKMNEILGMVKKEGI